MWYLAWILGVISACSVGIISVIRYEFKSEKSGSPIN